MDIKEARKLYEDERHGSCDWEKAVVYLQAIEKAKGLVEEMEKVQMEMEHDALIEFKEDCPKCKVQKALAKYKEEA